MFNLLRLELKKQFKKPLFILVMILILTLMISLSFVFSPIQVNDTFNIDTSLTAKDVYNDYQNQSFKIADELEQTKLILSYYNALKLRQDQIYKLNNDINVEYENLKLIKDSGNERNINEKALYLYELLDSYCYSISAFNNISNIDYIDEIAGNYLFINNSVFNNIRDITLRIKNYIDNDSSYGQSTYTLLTNNNYKLILDEATDISINFVEHTINSLYNNLLQSYNEYQEYLKSTTTGLFNSATANNKLNTFINNYYDYKLLYTKLMQFNSNIILCKQEVLDDIDKLILQTENIFNSMAITRQEHLEMLNKFSNIKLINRLKKFNQNFTIIVLDNDMVTELNTYLTIATDNFINNEKIIEESYIQNNSISLQEIVYKQLNLIDSISKVVNNTIILKYYENFNLSDKYIDDNQVYQYKCETTLAKYHITTNTYTAKVINNYQFNYQTNDTISCYDYIVYALQIATFVILIYMIYSVCFSISGESYNGTLNMTLMSPNKRSTILNSKILSNLIIMIILMTFSLLVSSITGIIAFGEEFTTIVTIFNAENIIEISPLIAILINYLCQLSFIIGYIIIVYLITVIIKNYPLSLIISTIITILTILLSKFNWAVLAILPTNNFYFNKYFYSQYYNQGNILNKIFDPMIYSSQNFYLSLAIYILFITITYIITINLFKKKSY